jgi:WD40 repeat protein
MALTRKASEAGLKIVDEARRKKCYDKYASSWYGEAKVSKSTLEKFWRREEIRHENFDTICAAIEVDWQAVIDESDRDVDNPQQQKVNQVDRFKGLKIAKQIHDWLVAVEYKLKEPYEVLEIDYCEWIIKIQDPLRRARVNHILIRGIASEAKLPELQALEASRKEQGAEGGWLIVNRRISPAVKTELDKDENQHLSCMTLDDLIDRDADFEPYLTWLEEEVIKRGIDRKYVSLACDKEEIDPVTQHSIATSSYGEAEGWIEGYIKQWLSDDSKEHVSILGEFGTGKTWFSFHYAWDCLRAYKEAKEQGLERPRLPLVIALRDYNKALKVESVLSDLFFNKHDIRLNSSVFDCLNQMGKLVIIFDGFDEMADKVDRQKMINNFWELARVVCPGSKVILTSRTEHFPHDRESRQLLNAELESSTAKLKWESPRFELLELAKFNETQIRHVLTLEAEEKGLSTDIVEKVMVRAELLDLARRPVMTELIIEAMPEIEAGKPVDMSRIYYYAIVRKMDRDIKAERTFTSLADKLYFLCEIAWEMLSTERMKLNYREFPDRIRQIFPQLVTEAKDLDHWHYDMMGQTILIRNADGDYTPAHRSLLEFLVAYKFAAEAGVLKADFVAAVQEQSDCIDGDAMPQDYTWTGYLQACVAAKCEERKIAPLRGFIPESSEYLRHTFGREPLTKAVIDLIVPILEPVNHQNLIDLIHSTKGKTDEETGWLGGNAATILVKQNGSALNGEDFSDTQMINSNLVDATLQRVNFTRSNLTNSLFQSVLLHPVLSIAMSQDSQVFVTGHAHTTVRIWNAINGQIIHTCIGHKEWVRSVAISPDNLWCLSASVDRTIKRWDIITGKCLQTYEGHKDPVMALAIAPDSSWFISGSDDRTIKRWDINTGKCLFTCDKNQEWIVALSIASDNSFFMSRSHDNTIKSWDANTGKCLDSTSNKDCSRTAAISPNGQFSISGCGDTVEKWDILTNCISIYHGHQNRITSLAISSDNNWFVSGSLDKTIKSWDANTGKCIQSYVGHTREVWVVVISSDGKWLMSGSADGTLKLWDTNTGKCIHSYTNHSYSVSAVTISADGKWLINGSEDHILKYWDVSTGKCDHFYRGHQGLIYTVGISADGNWFLSGSDDNTIKRWDTNTTQCLYTYRGHRKLIYTVAISADENWFLSGSEDRTIKRWSTFTGECLNTYEGHQDSVVAIAISPDGKWFVSGSHDNTIKRWDILTNECLQTYVNSLSSNTIKYSITTIAISPDGKWLISGSDDHKIKFWDTYSGECLHTYEGHQNWIYSVAISPDGKWLISGSEDHTIKRWDTIGNCLQTYEGHFSPVGEVVISSDGRYIISRAGAEIKIWDVETGDCLSTISNKPYAGMRIGGAIGLTSGQIESLKALGAVDD